MPRFSANLGFLWNDRPLPDAVAAAHEAGFAAVECHWPYDCQPEALLSALAGTGLPMLSINTSPGSVPGDFGLAALPTRRDEARAAVDRAVDYARRIGARHVHVMAGIAQGDAARAAYLDTLGYAADLAGTTLGVLIEPINHIDAPGYFLSSFDLAREVIETLNRPNLRMMIDCYHAGRMGLDVVETLRRHLPVAGHVQFAGVPDRGPPDYGDVDYARVFAALDEMGWTAPLGAEFRPLGATEASLGWMDRLG